MSDATEDLLTRSTFYSAPVRYHGRKFIKRFKDLPEQDQTRVVEALTILCEKGSHDPALGTKKYPEGIRGIDRELWGSKATRELRIFHTYNKDTQELLVYALSQKGSSELPASERY